MVSDHIGGIATQPPDHRHNCGELFGTIEDDPEPLAGSNDLLTFQLAGISSTFRVIGPASIIADIMHAAAGQYWKLAGTFVRTRGGRNALRLGGTYWYAKQIINNTESERHEVQLNFYTWQMAVMNRGLTESWPNATDGEKNV